MTLQVFAQPFSVCRPTSLEGVDLSREFVFFARTDDELSLVCETPFAPGTGAVEHGWRMLRIAGELDFALTGILARIAGILAAAEISIFAVSTYNTDYLFLREHAVERALGELERAGYAVERVPAERGGP